MPETAAGARDILLSSLVQGGAAGIYGDFLFGKVNRNGSTLLSNAAGPTVGTTADIWEAYAAARDGDPKGGAYLNLALSNNPAWPVNLIYVRPALDYVVVNSLCEAFSPGYLRREETRMKRETGQEYFVPRRMFGR